LPFSPKSAYIINLGPDHQNFAMDQRLSDTVINYNVEKLLCDPVTAGYLLV